MNSNCVTPGLSSCCWFSHWRWTVEIIKWKGTFCRDRATVNSSYFHFWDCNEEGFSNFGAGLIRIKFLAASSKCARSPQRSYLTHAGEALLEASPACPGVGHRMRKLHQRPHFPALRLIQLHFLSVLTNSTKWGCAEQLEPPHTIGLKQRDWQARLPIAWGFQSKKQELSRTKALFRRSCHLKTSLFRKCKWCRDQKVTLWPGQWSALMDHWPVLLIGTIPSSEQ